MNTRLNQLKINQKSNLANEKRTRKSNTLKLHTVIEQQKIHENT